MDKYYELSELSLRNRCRIAIRDYLDYIESNSIFVAPDLFELFDQLGRLMRDTYLEHQDRAEAKLDRQAEGP